MIARADCAKTIQEEMKMRESKFKNYDALPLTLTAPEVGEVLGISRAAAYELVRSKGFPHIRIGTQYRKRQRKAMGKPHYYQKVINSQPPLIFVYGVARFELLRRLPPTTTV